MIAPELKVSEILERPWHAQESEAALAKALSREEGLTDAEVRERLAKFGPNELPKAQGDGVLKLLWRQINNPLVFVLIAAGALAIGLGKGLDGMVVLAVVVLNTFIGFMQEFRAGKAIEALSSMVPENATVIVVGVVSAGATQAAPPSGNRIENLSTPCIVTTNPASSLSGSNGAGRTRLTAARFREATLGCVSISMGCSA